MWTWLVKEGKIRTGALLIFLFLINFIPGLMLMNNGLFHYDSVALAQATEQTYQTGALQGQIHGRYGSVIVNSIIYFPFYLAGQNADYATRFASVLFQALSIVALFLFIKELFHNRKLALFTSLLFSFVPLYFIPNTYGKEHGASIFFALIGLYFLIKGAHQQKIHWFILSGATYAFSIMIRESLIVLAPFYIGLYFFPSISLKPLKFSISREKFSLSRIGAWLLSFFVVFGIALYAYLGHVFLRVLFEKSTDIASFQGLFSPILHLAYSDLTASLPLLLFIVAGIGILLFTIKYFNENFFIVLYFLAWLALFFYFGNTSVYKARYLDLVVIPLALFAAFALVMLYNKSKWLSIGILVFLVGSMCVYDYPLLSFRHSYNGEKEYALFVKGQTEPNSKIIAMDDGIFINYYGNRSALGHPIGNAEETEKFVDNIKTLLSEGTPVYLSESGMSYDPGNLVQTALSENFNVTYVGSKLMEDYHDADIKFTKYNARLFKLELK